MTATTTDETGSVRLVAMIEGEAAIQLKATRHRHQRHVTTETTEDQVGVTETETIVTMVDSEGRIPVTTTEVRGVIEARVARK